MGCTLRLNINYPEFRRYHHNTGNAVNRVVPKQQNLKINDGKAEQVPDCD